mmetsp:Transcript_9899/g.17806  ORF Transcript_9899/g.17806 Transcript_9899/m.17806 type:complete len:217 (+) Transcript_9899:769-1419(+)
MMNIIQITQVVFSRHQCKMNINSTLQDSPTNTVMLIESLRQRALIKPLLNIIPPQLRCNTFHSLSSTLHSFSLIATALSIIHPHLRLRIINNNILRIAQVTKVDVTSGCIRDGIPSTDAAREADETRPKQRLLLEHFREGADSSCVFDGDLIADEGFSEAYCDVFGGGIAVAPLPLEVVVAEEGLHGICFVLHVDFLSGLFVVDPASLSGSVPVVC